MSEVFAFAKLHADEIWKATGEHLELSLIAVLLGCIVSVPLAVFLTRHRRFGKPILSVAAIIQTIPSLAMLALALPLFGIGFAPALAVLFLYSILPLLQNTYTGICDVSESLTEAARGVGMSNIQVLFRVEIPIAMPLILTGLRLSVVYVISWATLAGLVGAGGLGDLIYLGLSNYNYNYIVWGAIPASLLSIAASLLISLLTRRVISKGLRGR